MGLGVQSRLPLGALALIAFSGICAAALMFWITARGPGVSPDSVIYIETARSLLAGNGFSAEGKPMTHYPPVYPLLLALVGLFNHGDVVHAGRLIGALLFGVNLALLGLALLAWSNRGSSAAAWGMLVFLASAPIIKTHSMAWSEAPFITFALIAFILLSRHIARPRPSLLLAASLSVGCAIATRYIGVTLLPPMACALLFLGDRPMKRKIADTVLLTLAGSIPLASWLIRNILTAETATNRTLAIHVVGVDHANQMIATLQNFLLPIPVPGWAQALFLGLVAALYLASLALLYRVSNRRRGAHSNYLALPALGSVFFLTYILFLAISISFFDAATPLDDRLLLPAFLAILIVGISLAGSVSSALNSRIVWYGFLLFVLASVILKSSHAVREAGKIHRNGSGYASRKWDKSKTIALVMSLARDVKIYSNGPDALQFLTGRSAILIPRSRSSVTLEPNQDHEEQLQDMCNEVGEGRAIVVYLKGVKRSNMPTQQELESTCVMPVLGRLNDGTIYGLSKKQANQVSNS